MRGVSVRLWVWPLVLVLACASSPRGSPGSESSSSTTEVAGDSGDSSSGGGGTESESSGDGDPESSGDGDGEPGGDGDGEAPGVQLTSLAYGAHPAQNLDLYAPRRAPAPLTTIVLAHGGLWQAGDKSSLATLCEAIVASGDGLACASINYRLSADLGGVCRGAGPATYEDMARDFTAAVAFLRDQAEVHGLDPARVYVGGHSAGGHLAQLLDLRWAAFAEPCEGCPPPLGAIGIEGIYDVPAWDQYDAQFWGGQFACATRRAFGAPPAEPDACLDAQLGVPCWHAGSPTILAQQHAQLGVSASGDVLLVHSPDDDWVDVAEVAGLATALGAAFPDLEVATATDGSCGTGTHDQILQDEALAACIVAFVTGD